MFLSSKTSRAIAVVGGVVLLLAVGTIRRGSSGPSGIKRNLRNLQGGCEAMPANAYFHISSRMTKYLLSVEGASTLAGANVYQWHSHVSWRFEDTGNGFYHVIDEKSGLALAVADASTEKGANIVVEPSSSGAKNEDWCFVPREDGFYEIKNRNSGKSLDAQVNWQGDRGLGENVVQWWFHGGKNQQWKLDLDKLHSIVPPPPPASECAGFPPNTFYHIVGKQSGMALAVAGSLETQGANVVQVPISTPGTADHWRFTPTDSGYYQVFAQHSGMALQISGKNAVQGQASSGIEDDWCFVPVGDGDFKVQNRLTGKVLDVENFSVASGGNVHTWQYKGQDNQLFTLQTVDGSPAPPVPSPSPAPSPTNIDITPVESWKGPFGTPIVAVAAANLANGKILIWSAYMRDYWEYDTGKTWTAIFDPDDGSFTEKLVETTGHDMFCPGTATLADGRIMITGGADAAKTTFYNPQDNKWLAGPEMNIPRGYHSMAVLADGMSVFTVGGSWNGIGGAVARDGEIWSPLGGWRLLTGVPVERFLTEDDAGVYRSDNHGWFFLAPNGKVFHAGPSRRMHWVTTTGNGSVTDSVFRGSADRMNGNAQMYDIGKILVVGGAENYDTGAGTKEAFVIDINGAEATVSQASNMTYARTLCNSVVLPSGEVVVIGGQSNTELFSDADTVYAAEIFNPATLKFSTLSAMSVPRNYHSTAILMKDGRVMAGGGGLCGGCKANHRDMEILTPPYLIDSDGNLATRPVIKDYTRSAAPGSNFVVTMDSNSNHSFALVRISAVTHAVNNDQRRIPLGSTGKSGNSFTLSLPWNANVSVAGVYYLFAMDNNGVPSVGVDFNVTA